jgi:rhomboid protease GluP
MADQPTTIQQHPAHYVIVRRRFWPVATFTILALTFAVFLLMTFAGGSRNPEVLLTFGASYGPYLRRGEYWRLIMPMFLHIGWLHLLVNAYALFILGPILERVYGYGRFATLYVATGVGSSLLSMSLSNNIAAGASGAIFGIAGAMVVTGYLHRDLIPPRWGRAFGRGILPFILLNLIFGFSVRGIDNWGHLGGLVSGILLALLIPPPGNDFLPGTVEERPSQSIAVLPVVVVALAMMATVQHYRATQEMTRLLQDGVRLRAAHQNDRARERFEQAIRVAPSDERPHEQLAALGLEEGKYDEAIQEYNRALQLNPGNPETQFRLGIAYRLKGDLAKAQQIFESVLGKNPQTAEGHRILADLYAEQKLYADAVQHYKEALRLNPGMAEVHNNLAWLYATSEDPKYRNPQAALVHAQKAVELTQWRVAGFIDTLAEAYYASGRYPEAVKTQSKALELEPSNRELQEHMVRDRRAAGT